MLSLLTDVGRQLEEAIQEEEQGTLGQSVGPEPVLRRADVPALCVDVLEAVALGDRLHLVQELLGIGDPLRDAAPQGQRNASDYRQAPRGITPNYCIKTL